MKALVFTFVVMTVIVLGLPAVELLVIRQGWAVFACLVIILILLMVASLSFVFFTLLRMIVHNWSCKYYCKLTIVLGMIRTIYMLWDVKPADSGSLGMSTAIALTVFTVLFSWGFYRQTSPTQESFTSVLTYDRLNRKDKQ